MSEGSTSFVDLCLAGKGHPENIDDHVSRWHETPENGVERSVCLGLTPEEYARWVMDPEVLPALIAARRAGEPIRKIE